MTRKNKCNDCGEPLRQHGIDPATGDFTVCPVDREEKTTPPQEHQQSPSGDY